MIVKKGLNEEWRPVVGFEGLYEVSNFGEVRSLIRRTKSGLKKLRENNCGYLRVALSKNGVNKEYFVHRVVAATFIGECPEGMQVNHKDENKRNNCVENLEYVTPKENNCYGTHIERVANALSKPVAQYSLDGDLIAIYKSGREADRNTAADYRHISACCLGKLNQHAGYVWRFVTEDADGEV